VYFDFINPWTIGEKDIADQIAWLNATLSEARKDGEKVLIVGHTSPGSDIGSFEMTFQHYSRYCDAQFGYIVNAYKDVIIGSIYGHEVR
jgi:hypothetical protein